MSMDTHISQLASSCFGILSQIVTLHIRRSLTRSSLSLPTVITAFILSKVDYCNLALSGLLKFDLDRLQSIVNAAARLKSDSCGYDHITPLLNDLDWLGVPERNVITYTNCAFWCATVFMARRRAASRCHSACC